MTCERATRLWRMSPTMTTCRPCEPGQSRIAPAEGLAHGVEVEQRLGGVLVPAVAGVDHHAVVDPPGHPGRDPGGGVADDHGVDPDGLDRLDGVAQGLALVHRGGPGGEARARRPTSAWPPSRRTSGSGWSPRRTAWPPSGPAGWAPWGWPAGRPRRRSRSPAAPRRSRLGVQVVHAEQVGGERAHRFTSFPERHPVIGHIDHLVAAGRAGSCPRSRGGSAARGGPGRPSPPARRSGPARTRPGR